MRVSAKRLVGGAAMAGGALALRPGSRTNRALSHQVEVASRRLHYLSGRLHGVSYWLQGRHPSPDVIDNVLADRIRSELGGLEKRLDVPHLHVMVNKHVAILHGEVGDQADADQIERAVKAVSGVMAVKSYLHVGLGRGDSRPSAGRTFHAPSGALNRLLDAAVQEGIDSDDAPVVVRAVLAAFAERLPAAEREQVAQHLTADVQALFHPPRRLGRPERVRSVQELVSEITEIAEVLPVGKAQEITTAIVRTLRDLVPDEAKDVGAVLPAELRVLWAGDAN